MLKAHLVGENGAGIIHELSMAMTLEGMAEDITIAINELSTEERICLLSCELFYDTRQNGGKHLGQ